MTFLKEHKQQIVYGLVAVTIFVAGYLLGRLRTHGIDNDFIAEMEDLRSKETDAAVVKRVSQQMEAIAYQQKAISDKQRDRAEEQSQLALDMRDRAEMESQIARQAESRAVALATQAELSAAEAEKQKAIAQENQKEAEVQRDEATLAKSVSDTLNYRSLARALGNSATVQYDGNHEFVANMLAYVSWHFLDKYNGNTYQPEVFKALSLCSGTQRTFTMQKQGGVTAIESVPDGGFVAVSDFGEIEMRDASGNSPVSLYHNSAYDFRDVHMSKDVVFAISVHGPLFLIDKDRTVNTVDVPEDEDYIGLAPLPGNRLLIAGKRSYCIYDMILRELISKMDFERELNALTSCEDKVMLFFADGQCGEISNGSKVVPVKPLVGKVVTVAAYDKKNGSLYMGCSNGDIEVLMNNGTRSTLLGHVSRILSLAFVDEILVSGSYDRSTMIWNLAKMSGMNADDADSNKESTLAEWLTPVGYSFGGWPMSLCRIGDSKVLVGSSNGQIVCMEVSDRKMSSSILRKLPRSFTEEEWSTYVGSEIPYEKFK